MAVADAMVTGRMTREKKEEGNRILESLGTTPSKAINQLYDFVIEKKQLPFEEEKKRHEIDPEELAEARAWVRSFRRSQPTRSRFATMTDDEIKQERLIARGLATKEDFA